LRGIASALDNLASAIVDIEADLATAQILVEEALAIYRQLNARASMHNALYVYAYVLTWKGEYQLALQVLEERLDIVRHSGSKLNIVLAEVLLAGLDRLSGNVEQARIILEKSLRTMETSDQRLVQGWHYARTLHELAFILVRRGEADRAEQLLSKAFAACDMPEERTQLFLCNGSIAMSKGEKDNALANYLQCLEICQRSHFKLTAILALEGISEALSSLQVPHQATRLLAAAMAFRHKIGAPVSPWDLPGNERLQVALKEQLGEHTFAETWSNGQGITFDRAMEEALSPRLNGHTSNG
jgi:tetratricopeptide (TPR) repeat protein